MDGLPPQRESNFVAVKTSGFRDSVGESFFIFIVFIFFIVFMGFFAPEAEKVDKNDKNEDGKSCKGMHRHH